MMGCWRDNFSMTETACGLSALHHGNYFGRLLGAADRPLTELQSRWTLKTRLVLKKCGQPSRVSLCWNLLHIAITDLFESIFISCSISSVALNGAFQRMTKRLWGRHSDVIVVISAWPWDLKFRAKTLHYRLDLWGLKEVGIMNVSFGRCCDDAAQPWLRFCTVATRSIAAQISPAAWKEFSP